MAFISNGTTILDNGAFDVSLGSQILISESTASGSASISFTSGIDSTYDIYQFEFFDIHPATNNTDFQFQADTGTNTNYNQTITSTCFETYHNENNADQGLGYRAAGDQAQGTGFQDIGGGMGNENDNSTVGTLTIFNPSSSVYVKHFIATTNYVYNSAYTDNHYVAGYINTTTPLTRFQFKMSSGNIDAGTIKMYGIKGS